MGNGVFGQTHTYGGGQGLRGSQYGQLLPVGQRPVTLLFHW